MAGWRVLYEQAAINWIREQQPSLLQVIAVLEGANERSALGPPEERFTLPDPDPEYPEDLLAVIPMANIDVRFLANSEVSDGPLIFIRRFASY